MNFVQEVQVLTSGFQAEYGRSTGGVFNVVTKSGSNEFHGDVFNYNKPSRSYNALELTLTRAFADRWHLNSSFVYAKASGNHEGLYMSGYDQLDPNITALYDIPSFLPNSDGRLRSDKPYQFKMFGAYSFAWGLTLSEGFLVSAGSPISAQGPEIVNATVTERSSCSRAAHRDARRRSGTSTPMPTTGRPGVTRPARLAWPALFGDAQAAHVRAGNADADLHFSRRQRSGRREVLHDHLRPQTIGEAVQRDSIRSR